MKQYLFRFLFTYFLFVSIFVLLKPVFISFYPSVYGSFPLMDWLKVIWHGLPLDLSVAGYLTVIPGLLYIASLWMVPEAVTLVRKIYYLLVALLLSAVYVTDLLLYGYWGFRLDSTALFYFFSSPKDALASVGLSVIIGGIAAFLLFAFLLYTIFRQLLIRKDRQLKVPFRRSGIALMLLSCTALLFIPIRGSFTVSVMNLSKAYFSHQMVLNHAAINPCFSLLESLSRNTDFDKQYRFMEPDKADRLFRELTEHQPADSLQSLLLQQRPNVVMVILESFMSGVVESLGGVSGVTPHLDRLAREGILFSNFYANSFRTDRGLVAILSGFPAQPTTSIMKYPQKTQTLPSIPQSLKKAGYSLSYYYGGDADFTNMRSYLVAMEIDYLVADKDFPLKERLSKWGAHDHVVFNRVIEDLSGNPREPFMAVVQTSSSHEPFQVPYQRLDDPFLNSVAYTDSCLGDFIHRYRETGLWENTLFILVPDHAARYPESVGNLVPERYQIPLIFTGGAVKGPAVYPVYGSQMDIAATLLAQMELSHSEFTFSKNLLNPASPHFAFYTFPNAFGLIREEGGVVFDCESDRVLYSFGKEDSLWVLQGQAFLQKLYDDIALR